MSLSGLATTTAATHAGAITAKLDSGTIRILLVTAKKDRAQWIFPKGHIEPGEPAETAALRELREEAGIAGNSLGPLGQLAFGTDEGEVVDYYLVQFVAEQGKGEPERQVQWFRFDDAVDRLTFPDAKKLLSDLRLTIEERMKKSQPG
jgi:8-oxo-dGTP pyrophosphatase MutT (NUDIX family)